MRVQIINGGSDKWYGEVVGTTFDVWEDPNDSVVYYANWGFLILKSDTQIISKKQIDKRKKEAYKQTN